VCNGSADRCPASGRRWQRCLKTLSVAELPGRICDPAWARRAHAFVAARQDAGHGLGQQCRPDLLLVVHLQPHARLVNRLCTSYAPISLVTLPAGACSEEFNTLSRPALALSGGQPMCRHRARADARPLGARVLSELHYWNHHVNLRVEPGSGRSCQMNKRARIQTTLGG
jgi:hypothetical protein